MKRKGIGEMMDEIINWYGDIRQINKANEELAELSAELSRHLYREGTNDSRSIISRGIISEMADVYNVLAELERIFNVDTVELDRIRREKMERQYNRMIEDRKKGACING